MPHEARWSPDGRFIAYTWGDRPEGRFTYGLSIWSADNPAQSEVLFQGHPIHLDWSPDGKRLLVTTLGTPGRNEIWLVPLPERYWP